MKKEIVVTFHPSTVSDEETKAHMQQATGLLLRLVPIDDAETYEPALANVMQWLGQHEATRVWVVDRAAALVGVGGECRLCASRHEIDESLPGARRHVRVFEVLRN